MSSKGMRLDLCLLLAGVLSISVGLAADVTPQVYVDFLGKLEGTAYKLGAREFDKTNSFAAHHGTEIVKDSLGVLMGGDQSGQESFEFDASAFNHNATTFADVPFVVEAVFTPTGSSDFMAPIIDIGGQAFIRFHTGLSAGSYNGSTVSNDNIRTIPAAGETHHYAIVYDGANKINYYLDSVAIFQSTNGSPQQITKWVSWGNIRHPSVNGTRQLIGKYDAVAFSTFSGEFDPTKDFILSKDLSSAGAAFEPVSAVNATGGSAFLNVKVDLRDGSMIYGVMDPAAVHIKSDLIGNTDLRIDLVSRITPLGDRNEARVDFRNGDRVTGSLEHSTVNFKTAFGDVVIPIKLIERISISSPTDKKTLR